jgi:predicted transcriptional regulator
MSKDTNRRSRWEISYDILEATAAEGEVHGGKAKKTRIMQAAHLDWRNFKRYFDFLLEQGFIASSERGDYYYLTEKGINLREQLRELRVLLEQPIAVSQNLFPEQL